MDKFDGSRTVSKKTTNILERPLNKGRNEVHISSFALLFSEIVQYSQNRVTTVADLQTKLSDLGKNIGSRMLDLLVLREKGYKRETRIINVLLFIKTTVWKSLFGKEADKLEQSNDDDKTFYEDGNICIRVGGMTKLSGWLRHCLQNGNISKLLKDYIIEKEPLVNKFISRQKDKGGLNCAYFISGIVEEILFGCNFELFVCSGRLSTTENNPIIFACDEHCHVTAHWHKGTTFMIQFDESVIARDKAFDAR